ncbi:molybdopterin molybdotransferase MoeA [Rhodobacteraceae bacterium]|nr:molybdopterin molybdotransferase MoeA [Paracoccaceae bacterium]
MITVDRALGHIFDLVTPLASETISIRHAANRVLTAPVVAARNQPPFRASVMDGYAVAGEHSVYTVIGEAAAGHEFSGCLEPGQATRIFTGAPLPTGATRVIIQEDIARDGDQITVAENADTQAYIRDIGVDFSAGDRIEAPRRLTPADLALCAAMNVAQVTVARKPQVALVATGDELVMPGEVPRADQIIASNTFGLAAMFEAEGATARLLPIAGDTHASLEAALHLAATADLVVTIGGASVGDHDLVGEVAGNLGLDRAFYKIAMRPGKPLMAGRIDGTPMVGLPGNPVSSMVCGHIFLRPMLRAMQGLAADRLVEQTAHLANPIPANGNREHYMRAHLDGDQVTVADRQDSSLLSVLSGANALVIRAPHAPAGEIGETVSLIKF